MSEAMTTVQGVPISVLLAFLATCVLLAVTPGPNMSVIIANTTSHGLKAGLISLAGTGTAMAVLVGIAALGMTSVMRLMSEWFDIIRWVGAAYLAWLGASQLYKAWRGGGSSASVVSIRGGRWYLQGVLVGLSNPKVLLFLGALLPQFISEKSPPGPQLALLASIFVVVLVAVDVAYTIALSVMRARLNVRHFRKLDIASGAMLLAGGAVLMLTRRP